MMIASGSGGGHRGQGEDTSADIGGFAKRLPVEQVHDLRHPFLQHVPAEI